LPQLWEGVPATITLYLVCLQGIEDESNHLYLIPSTLRRELHGVRATIEAYSEKNAIERVKGEGAYGGRDL
jgi:hypothetical protein